MCSKTSPSFIEFEWKTKKFFNDTFIGWSVPKGQVNSAYDIRYPRVINNNFQKYKRVSHLLGMIFFQYEM